MPLEDDTILSHNRDGSLNEDYCKWCYADGTYTYSDMDELIDVCTKTHGESGLFRRSGARIYEGNAAKTGLLETV